MMKTAGYFSAIGCWAMLSLSGTAAEVFFNGGKIVPLESMQVRADVEDLNFCFATRYPDGSIHLNHSIGVHGEASTERGASALSADNGKSWKTVSEGSFGLCGFTNTRGEKMQLGCWSSQLSRMHQLRIRTLDGKTGKVTESSGRLEFPYATRCHLHRDVIRLRDGRLLVTGYGAREGAAKYHNFVFESADDGKSWHYLSAIADDPAGKTSEGPSETSIWELKNGDIVAVYRVGGLSPMRQSVSKDGGKSWSAPVEIASFSASPHGRVLADGTVVIVSGRPDLNLLVDFTGEGKNYQSMRLYRGSGSSYGSVVETAPNEILVIYDESNFGVQRGASSFNRIIASRFKVVRDDKLLFADNEDPRLKEYRHFYSPATRRLPQELGLATAVGYRKKSPNWLSYAEIAEIPERPQPVLRIVSRGVKENGSAWGKFHAQIPETTATLRIGFAFRLSSAEVRTPQFMVSGSVKTDDGSRLGYASFASDGIHYLDGGKKKVLAYDFRTSRFQDFRMELDGRNGTWTLTRQGEEKPVLTARLSPTSGAPAVSWGDGSAEIFGSAELSYIGWQY